MSRYVKLVAPGHRFEDIVQVSQSKMRRACAQDGTKEAICASSLVRTTYSIFVVTAGFKIKNVSTCRSRAEMQDKEFSQIDIPESFWQLELEMM